MTADKLNDYLLKQVYAGTTGLDIMHGELKNLIVEWENEDFIEEMDKPYREGYLEALTDLYALSYNLSFALNERTQKRG